MSTVTENWIKALESLLSWWWSMSLFTQWWTIWARLSWTIIWTSRCQNACKLWWNENTYYMNVKLNHYYHYTINEGNEGILSNFSVGHNYKKSPFVFTTGRITAIYQLATSLRWLKISLKLTVSSYKQWETFTLIVSPQWNCEITSPYH